MPTSLDLEDTIVAVATAAGVGATGVVRLSGPRSIEAVAEVALTPDNASALREPGGYRGAAVELALPEMSVPAWAAVFRAPRSYTGEDAIELTVCGAPLVLGAVVSALAGRPGVRWARPGEFTLRAFLRGKLDLSQAEAVATLIGSTGEEEARAARRGLRGELGQRVRAVADGLIETLALIEAGLDFPDEELPELAPTICAGRVDDSLRALDALRRMCGARAADDGTLRVVLAGRPNAGKSTLLNALLGRDAAIATRHAGTTRDPVRGVTTVGSRRVEWTDLAGVYSLAGLLGAGDSAGPAEVEVAGGDADVVWEIVRRITRAEIEAADVVVWVVDPGDGTSGAGAAGSLADWRRASAGPLSEIPAVVAVSKGDRLTSEEGERWRREPESPVIVSGLRHRGLEELSGRVLDAAAGSAAGAAGSVRSPRYLVSAHQSAAFSLCQEALRRAREAVEERGGDELVAADIREALDALDDLTGRVTADVVLDQVFSRFCIGK